MNHSEIVSFIWGSAVLLRDTPALIFAAVTEKIAVRGEELLEPQGVGERE